MRIYRYIIIFLIFSFVSCGKYSEKKIEESTSNTKSIDIDLNTKLLKVEDVFEYSHFIVLETTEEALISEITKVEFRDDYIYILDSRQKVLFVFNKDGSYSHKIYRLGQSPEEYISIMDFYLDTVGQNIYILDGMQGYILVYGFDGTFKERHEVKKSYSLSKVKDSWLLYLGNGNADFTSDKKFNNLVVYNQNFEEQEEGLPFNPELLGRKSTFNTTRSIFTDYKEQCFIFPLNDYKIYEYSNDSVSLSVAYTINFKGLGDLSLSPNANSKEVAEYLSTTLNNPDIPSKLHSFYKLDNAVSFGFLYKSARYYCLIEEDGYNITLLRTGFDQNGIMFNPASYVSDKKSDLVLSIVEGSTFNISKKRDKTKNKVIKEISDAQKNIDDANPILLFYNIKNKKY